MKQQVNQKYIIHDQYFFLQLLTTSIVPNITIDQDLFYVNPCKRAIKGTRKVTDGED